MKNEKVSLRLSRLSVSNKLNLANEIVIAMAGNVHFPNPNPSLAAVTAACNNVHNTQLQILAGDRSKTDQRNAYIKTLDNLLLQLANYVEGIANAAALSGADAKAIIASAGMPHKKEKGSNSVPQAPENLSASITGIEGEIKLSWSPVSNALVYVLESCASYSLSGTNTNAEWIQHKITSRHSHVISGLNSGIKYAFRVYCVGRHGESPYSMVIIAKVL